MTTPANGSTLPGASVTFNWTNTAASPTWLYVGSTVGGSNFFSAATGTGTSQLVTGLPTTGIPIYVRLWTFQMSVWRFIDYHYTAFAPPTAAVLLTPTIGSSAQGTTTVLHWTTGAGVTNKWLYVGTSLGGADLYNASQGSATFVSVPGLPTTGVPLYARLWSFIGGTWQFTDRQFNAFETGIAQMTSPPDNSTLGGSSVTFAWNKPAATTQVWLYVGTSPGGFNIYTANEGVGTSRLVTGIPVSGAPVYVRLWSFMGGTWKYIDYYYTAAGALVETTLSPSE
jgi:hypothetical protein